MRRFFAILLVLLPFAFTTISSPFEPAFSQIYQAIRTDDLSYLQNNLSAGSNVDITDDRGRTPLMYACRIGSLEAVKVLLAHRAKVNATDSVGTTPLMFAMSDIAKVRLLLDAGADPNVKSMRGQTPVLIAAANPNSLGILRLLVSKGADLKAIGAKDINALIVAAEAGDLATVQYLIDQGLDVNATDRTDKTPHTALMAAAAQGSTAIVKLLVDKGANVNMAATDVGIVRNGPLALKGLTALMMAAAYGSPELIRTLLDAHADVNVRDVRGMTPLMLAVASENQDANVVKMLLSAGAAIDAKDANGETALDWARKYGNPTTLNLFHGDTASSKASSNTVSNSSMPSGNELRGMVQKSLALVQSSSSQFVMKASCLSCHHQNQFGALAVAREKGIVIDEEAARNQRQKLLEDFRAGENNEIQRVDIAAEVNFDIYALANLQAEKYQPDEITDSMVVYVMSRQFADGHWPRDEESRSPLADGDVNRVGLAISVMKTYGPPSLKSEVNEHIRRAEQWLLKAKPKTTDDYACLLLGLKASGAPEAKIRDAAQGLFHLQRVDGGWGGNQYLESDAYATGQALAALYDAGFLKTNDAVYERGLKFLLNTRASDGSWHVRSRAPKFQPYFESGFPYGHDQWISAAGTARAALALARYIQ